MVLGKWYLFYFPALANTPGLEFNKGPQHSARNGGETLKLRKYVSLDFCCGSAAFRVRDVPADLRTGCAARQGWRDLAKAKLAGTAPAKITRHWLAQVPGDGGQVRRVVRPTCVVPRRFLQPCCRDGCSAEGQPDNANISVKVCHCRACCATRIATRDISSVYCILQASPNVPILT